MRLRHILISLLTMLAVIPATAGMFSRSDPVITADPAAVKGASLQPYKYNGKELDLMHGLNTYVMDFHIPIHRKLIRTRMVLNM